MALNIPVTNNPDRTITTTIGGEDYDIRTRWNTFDEGWYLYIGLSARVPAIKVKVLGGMNLLEPYQHLEGVPDGYLVLLDIDVGDGRPTLQNFGFDKRFRLYLFTEDDFTEE